jgi:hypothetical protein
MQALDLLTQGDFAALYFIFAPPDSCVAIATHGRLAIVTTTIS